MLAARGRGRYGPDKNEGRIEMPSQRQPCSWVCSGVQADLAGSMPESRQPTYGAACHGFAGAWRRRPCLQWQTLAGCEEGSVQFSGNCPLRWTLTGSAVRHGHSDAAGSAGGGRGRWSRRRGGPGSAQLAVFFSRVACRAVRQRSSAVSSSSCICWMSSSCCSSCWRRSAIMASMMLSCFWLPALGS